MKKFEKIQPGIRQEIKRISLYICIGNLVMWMVWLGLSFAFPGKIVFDYTVLLGGIGGGLAALIDFVWLGMTLQRAVDIEDTELAKRWIRAGYTKRSVFRIVWVAVAIMAPCFHYIAAIIPLVFPGTGIKISGMTSALSKKENKEVM